MMSYRMRPVIVEAFRWTYDIVPDWWVDRQDTAVDTITSALYIYLLTGTITARIGDYIILDSSGTISVCPQEHFDFRYEKV